MPVLPISTRSAEFPSSARPRTTSSKFSTAGSFRQSPLRQIRQFPNRSIPRTEKRQQMPGKTVMLSKWSKFVLKLAAASAIGLLLQSANSFAQSTGSTPIDSVLTWIIGTLEGGIAKSFAIIAVSFLGFMAMTGRLSWQLAGSIIIGIALVFGAEKLVIAVRDTVS
ncbi:hypothetical protein C5748_08055 [Phyllobacterium phragmitis]|uniref:VIRB2 type IV secretion n=2 Tax=Phyllobacterium phragmitis TaxID=2670329 RepID=A0A2S9ITF3_9HYPH|nr:hypothetical protein C5748_08055 [Phyllobacterium phragmitis]